MNSFNNKNYFAAGLLMTFNGLVLLGRRSRMVNKLSGYWSMPCGMIEANEDPKTASIREFEEETAIDITGEVSFLDEYLIEEDKYFIVFQTEVDDFMFPSLSAKDAIEHDEWGYFKINEGCLPQPMTDATENSILKLR